jgi:hypothetical protein
MTATKATALFLVLATGCSFTMQEAPDPPYQRMPDCESSRAKPVVDLLGAGTALSLALTFALVAAIEDSLDETGSGDSSAGTAALVSLGAGAVFTVSSIGGFRKASRCRSAEAEFTTMMYYNMQRPAYPYPAPAPATTAPPATTTTTTTTTTPPATTTTTTKAPPPAPPRSTVPVGAERGLCRTDGSCDPGLTCASGHCVFLPR